MGSWAGGMGEPEREEETAIGVGLAFGRLFGGCRCCDVLWVQTGDFGWFSTGSFFLAAPAVCLKERLLARWPSLQLEDVLNCVGINEWSFELGRKTKQNAHARR